MKVKTLVEGTCLTFQEPLAPDRKFSYLSNMSDRELSLVGFEMDCLWFDLVENCFRFDYDCFWFD